MDSIKTLLEQINLIIQTDRQIKAERRESGEDFNVFEALALRTAETRLHSPLIAALLDPRTNHGQRDQLLRSFIETIAIADLGLDAKNCTVESEVCIGDANQDNGGRIDILIHDGQRAVVIENKIYATDQDKQLIRYDTYARKRFGTNYRLLYLTLDGKEPSPKSAGETNKRVRYINISYRTDILTWLDKSLHIAQAHPALRETINQYRAIIAQLTANDMDSQTSKDLVKIVTESENSIRSACKIAENIAQIKNYLTRNILLEQLKTEGLEIVSPSTNFETIYSGFHIRIPRWNNFQVAFQFQSGNFQNLCFGIISKEEATPPSLSILAINETARSMGFQHNNTWHCFKYMAQHRCWQADSFVAIKDGQMCREITKSIREIEQMTTNLDM